MQGAREGLWWVDQPMEAEGISQGIEFTAEGDKLFVGSANTRRIEAFDVMDDYRLRKNPKFLNFDFGNNILTINPWYKN